MLKGHDEFRNSLCKQAQGIRDARSKNRILFVAFHFVVIF